MAASDIGDQAQHHRGGATIGIVVVTVRGEVLHVRVLDDKAVEAN